MIRLPPRSTRTDTLFPYTTLFRSADLRLAQVLDARQGELLTDPRGVGVDDLPQQQLGPHSHNLTSHAASMPQGGRVVALARSEEHTSELQSLMRISYAVFCLKKKKINQNRNQYHHHNKQTSITYNQNNRETTQ